jgi:hypothetical protein
MKNAISYYYNITANVIHQTGKTFKFTNNGENYILTTCEREDIDDIYELSYNLIKQGVLCHQIILNNSNSIITNINNLPYILMKVLVNNDKITLNDIINFNNTIITVKLDNLRRDNWFNLWCNKVDYFEYQVNQMGKKYPIIRESFSYYIGLAEIGISLFKNTNKSEKLSLSHRRILYGQSLTELYNPINLIIDLRIRDACEYFKSCFFNNIDVEPIISNYLYTSNLDETEKILFLSRMLYPSYYFDVYEQIIDGKLDENELKKIINKVDEYELLLRNIYSLLKNNNFPEVEFLNKAHLN